MNSLVEQIIINILTEEMSLDPASIWIRQQNVKIPSNKTLFFAVGMTSTPIVIGNVTYMQAETVNAVVQQHQISETQVRETIEIDIMSSNTDAITRWPEVVQALDSFYAQQQQELNNFRIFRPESIVNTSGAEGGSNINRYSISVPCILWYRKDKLLNSPLGDYYDDFTTRLDDAATIGTATPVAEFEITPDSPPPIP